MKKILLAITTILLLTNVSVAHAFSTVAPAISAWLPSWDFEKGKKTIETYPHLFNEISPFWYYLNDDGSIGVSTGGENQEFVNQLHTLGIKVIPSITNSFKDERATAVMADDAKRKDFVKRVMSVVKKFNYDGFDIDFEGLKLTNKENFVALLNLLATELHKENKFLTVAVQAKSADPGPWETVQAQDWKKIAQAVDRFRIMAYDEHYSGSTTAGAISSKPWMQTILNFAKTQVPAEKLIIGMPMYGYNWGEQEKTYAVTFDDVEYLLKKFKPAIQWHEQDKEPFFTYVKPAAKAGDPDDNRTVYFQNKQSISEKWTITSQYPVSGVVFWRLGGEDQSIWQYLTDQKKTLLKTGTFADVNSDHWAYKYIQALRANDLSQGVNNQFFPEKELSRAEALKIVLKAGQIPATTLPAIAAFKDVPAKEWFSSVVATARTRGIVSGQGENFFPYRSLTRSEALKIIQKAYGLKAPKTIDRPNDIISRAEFAKLVAISFRLV